MDEMTTQIVNSVPISDVEIAQLKHHVLDHKAACAYSCAIIERLVAGAINARSAAVRIYTPDAA